MPGFRNRLSSILGRAIALPSHTQGGSRMRESRPYGSVRGARGETRVPTATGTGDGALAHLLDHLVGADEQRRWQGKSERIGRLEVDHQLVFHRRLHRQVCRLLAFEDAIDV